MMARNPASSSTAAVAARSVQESSFTAQMRELLERGDIPEVVNQTTAVIERDANNVEALLWRGKAYMRQSLGFKATDDLDAAIRADAEFVEAYKERSVVRYAMGDRDVALADLNRAAQLAPSDATIPFALAKFYWDSADVKNATAQLSRAISLSPSEAAYYTARAVLYWEQGDAQAALTDAARAIELAPDSDDAYLVSGRVLVDSGEYERGIADLTKAIQINPKQADALEKRGYAYFMLGDRSKADTDRLAANRARRR
jgi:tetratricopeptide (TPR) repeat protein